MDYLKLFQTHEEYEAFVSGGTMVKPNVSHCVSENEIHYNPWTDPRLIVKYKPIVLAVTGGNTSDLSEGPSEPVLTPTETVIKLTQLYFYASEEGMTIDGATMFDKVEIDGVEVSIADLDAASGQAQLLAGEHTVKYTLKDPTFIGADVDVQTQTITKIGALFVECPSVISVNIPNSVTTIGYKAFAGCSSLSSITIEATTPPTLGSDVFNVNASGRKIYVPANSVNTYKTANGWSAYAADIEPIQ